MTQPAPSSPNHHRDQLDDVGGARAIEVAAMLGDSVIGVKHCMDPRGGKVTAKTWGLFAGGLAMLLTSAAAFYISVDNAAFNQASLDYHTRVEHKPAYAYRPRTTSAAVGWAAFGGLALGLAGMTAGLVRVRRERRSPFYRIGTAPGVEQPIENAPAADFPLVAPSGDDFVFNYGAGIDGELTLGGESVSLAELAASGRARPSMTTAGALELPIPANARIRARAGQTTFVVSAVPRPRPQPVPLFANVEGRTLSYFAGSLAVHLAIIAFLQTVPVEAGSVALDLELTELVTTTTTGISPDEVPPEQDDRENGEADAGEENTGAKMALDEGEAGKPDATREDGRLEIKDNHTEPQLSRKEQIEAARDAGFLGSASVLRGGIAALASQTDFSSGFSEVDTYGSIYGSAGEGRGNFGYGLHGFGRGAGCPSDAHCGIIGTGRYGTIGTGDEVGDGWRGGGTHGPLGRKHTAGVPDPTLGRPILTDGLDKAIIKRHIKRNLAKIRYCYERELLARPGLEGSMKVQFMITANGNVAGSVGSGFDSTVASCVAGVVKNINFPKPSDGGNVQVTYPFSFRAAGS